MMFCHTVLLEFYDPKYPSKTDFVQQQCDYLKAEISELQEIFFKRNVYERGNEYTHAIVALFANSDDHDAYQVHPAHTLVRERVKDAIKSVLVLDYEVT